MTNFKLITYRTMQNAALERAWRNMEKQNSGLSPFCYFDYLKYIFQETARWSLTYSPRIVCVESSKGDILMIAPIKKNIYKGTWKMLGDTQGCGHTDFLFAPGLSEEEADRCIKLLMEKIGKKIKLRRIEENSGINSYFARCGMNIKSGKQSCVILKFTTDVDRYIKALSPSVRQNLRTAYNRMKRDQVKYELKVWISDNTMEQPIRKRIMKLYLKRLFEKYKAGNLFYKLHKTILYTYTKHDTHSLYELSNSFHAALFTEGQLMCFMSGFTDHSNTRVVIPRLAINDTYKFYSPGYLLICETMRWLASHSGIREIDLSRGIERYKTDLGGELYHTYSYLPAHHPVK